MSIKATNYVRRLRGLSVSERSLAWAIADHVNHKTNEVCASMATLAKEASIKNRETASRITKRLESYRLIRPKTTHSKGGGHPGASHTTTYIWTFECDSPITLAGNSECDSKRSECDSTPHLSVTQNALSVTPQSHKGFEGVQEKGGRGTATATASPSLPASEDSTLAQEDLTEEDWTVYVDEEVSRHIDSIKTFSQNYKGCDRDGKTIEAPAVFTATGTLLIREALTRLMAGQRKLHPQAAWECYLDDEILDRIVERKIQSSDVFAMGQFSSQLGATLYQSYQHEEKAAQARLDEELRIERLTPEQRAEEAKKAHEEKIKAAREVQEAKAVAFWGCAAV